jgi:glycosyltransferase involved in cell wall biosynthesis
VLSDTRSALAKHGISVALCTFNGERYLGEQLQSIAAQTILPSELVVCDDASSDNTLGILEAFASVSPFPVRIFRNEQRLGSTRNFEKAIRLCEAEIIALSDQDDVWYPHKLEELGTLLTSGADLVFSDADVVDARLTHQGYRLWETVLFGRREQLRVEKGKAFDVLLRRNVVTGATMAFRSGLREFVLPIPEIWVHDGWIALHAAAVGNIMHVEEPLVAYRQHGSNQIGANRHRYSYEMDNIFEARTDLLCSILDQYEEALRYQKSLPATSAAVQNISKLEKKVRHSLVRLAARRGNHSVRLRDLIQELVSGRYHSYGRGLLSFFKDMQIFGRQWIRRLLNTKFISKS